MISGLLSTVMVLMTPVFICKMRCWFTGFKFVLVSSFGCGHFLKQFIVPEGLFSDLAIMA